jgi:hypothetical protein
MPHEDLLPSIKKSTARKTKFIQNGRNGDRIGFQTVENSQE